jgi:hypothetical protein
MCLFVAPSLAEVPEAAALSISEVAACLIEVRSMGHSGLDLLTLSSSHFDAVDGAHSAASKCHRVVALEQTTLRGAVHGQG